MFLATTLFRTRLVMVAVQVMLNPFFFTRSMGPIYPVYAHNQTTGDYLLNSLGERFYDYGNLSSMGIPNRPGGASPGRHVIEETKLNQSLFKRNTISGRSYGSIIFTPWLKFTTNISIDITDYNVSSYENTLVGDGAPGGRPQKLPIQEHLFYISTRL
ncbi:MAG: hypothetical protein IPJ29_03445 [Chitinophagaceae bacterium]|nr:hypothetical protein [Chitinophagaceae bacterium]